MSTRPKTALRSVSGSTHYAEGLSRAPAPSTRTVRSDRKVARQNRKRGRS